MPCQVVLVCHIFSTPVRIYLIAFAHHPAGLYPFGIPAYQGGQQGKLPVQLRRRIGRLGFVPDQHQRQQRDAVVAVACRDVRCGETSAPGHQLCRRRHFLQTGVVRASLPLRGGVLRLAGQRRCFAHPPSRFRWQGRGADRLCAWRRRILPNCQNLVQRYRLHTCWQAAGQAYGRCGNLQGAGLRLPFRFAKCHGSLFRQADRNVERREIHRHQPLAGRRLHPACRRRAQYPDSRLQRKLGEGQEPDSRQHLHVHQRTFGSHRAGVGTCGRKYFFL